MENIPRLSPEEIEQEVKSIRSRLVDLGENSQDFVLHRIYEELDDMNFHPEDRQTILAAALKDIPGFE